MAPRGILVSKCIKKKLNNRREVAHKLVQNRKNLFAI